MHVHLITAKLSQCRLSLLQETSLSCHGIVITRRSDAICSSRELVKQLVS